MSKKISELNEVSKEILKVLKSKVEIKSESENFSNSSKIYSIANIINALNDKYKTLKICQALDDVDNCEELNVKYILVKNFYFDERFPYFYLSDIVSDKEAISLKEKLESWSEKQARSYNLRKKEMKKKLTKQSKKRKVSQKQLDALKRAREAKKK